MEHNKRLDELRKLYLKERQELSTMLVSAIQRQEVRSDTISSSDIQQNQQPSSNAPSTASAAMQMQQHQHHQMMGTGGVQIVPFVNTDGSIQPINLVPQQLSVSSMQQFQMLQQGQHPYIPPQQYSATAHIHGAKPQPQGQGQNQQITSSTQPANTPSVVSQQATLQAHQPQQLRHGSQQPQLHQINNPVQQPSRAQGISTLQSQTIRPIQQSQQYQGQQSQSAQVASHHQQSTQPIAQEQQSRYSQSLQNQSQMVSQHSSTPTPAAQTQCPQAMPNASAQNSSILSNSGLQQPASSASHVQGVRADHISSERTSQPSTAHQQPLQPTYYFAPQPTYPVVPGVGESSNGVTHTQWPQVQAMTYIPQQSGTQIMQTSQGSVNSVPTSNSGEAQHSVSTECRQPAVAAHAFHHYQNGTSHVPHQLVLVPQPQNFTYLPHSGGHLPLTTYHPPAGLHSIQAATGFAPLQPTLGQASTSSPTPSAISQQSQQSQQQEPSATSYTKPLQQVAQQPIPISGVKMMTETPITAVSSAHVQVAPTHTTNQPTNVAGQQSALPIVTHGAPQMQPQYQPSVHSMQSIPQHPMISGHPPQQHVPLQIGSMMHATTTTGCINSPEAVEHGNPGPVMDSSINQSHAQPVSNVQQSVQQQMSVSSQPSQLPGAT